MLHAVLETEAGRRLRLLRHAASLEAEIPAAIDAVGLDAGEVVRWILQGRFDDSSNDLLRGLREALEYALLGAQAPHDSDAAIAEEAVLGMQHVLAARSAAQDEGGRPHVSGV
jgi:hypothetical protein